MPALPDFSDFDAFLAAQEKEADFTGVVRIVSGDRVLFSGAYGLASRRWPVPVTENTRFDVASVTKLFTAVAVLQQVAVGRLALDDSIAAHVDLAGTTISEEVTLRHLLTHTSGIADDADEEAGEVRSLFKEGVNTGASAFVAHRPAHDLDFAIVSSTESGAWARR